ncbi:cue domain containing 2 [Holotrichia oblita]|uniref:Cue domain containing 2 n=1 Tax=Holotrichia oblita TaxID=644536 RepID=A0ACB9SIJ4_HOLOL|nr:cue domain containing 2 [Holotrichia oblita]
MMSTRKIAEQESTIKDSLFEFVKKHIPDADLTLIDEIVLSYVVAILEDVSSDPVFDVEGPLTDIDSYSLFDRMNLLYLSDSNSESVDTPKRIHKISEMSDGGSTDS